MTKSRDRKSELFKRRVSKPHTISTGKQLILINCRVIFSEATRPILIFFYSFVVFLEPLRFSKKNSKFHLGNCQNPGSARWLVFQLGFRFDVIMAIIHLAYIGLYFESSQEI